jgi:hypothetical protein
VQVPFFFVTGDEYFWDKVKVSTVKEYLGDEQFDKELNSTEVWH